MSLISDSDFLIHSIRLNYLRNVEDPYGPRLISLDPSYNSNPYIVTSGFADVERWPELVMSTSPAPSDDESGTPNRPNRHLGATGLKYTTTIMGPSRVGAMGLRVSGKRASASRASFRASVRSEGDLLPTQPEHSEVDAIPAGPSSASPMRATVDLPTHDSSGEETAAVGSRASPKEYAKPEQEPSPHFVPKFKGAAEMEARRRMRMLSRARPGVLMAKPISSSGNLDPELSSSGSSMSVGVEEDDITFNEEEEDFDLAGDADGSMDEFEPEFAASRGPSGLDIASVSVSDGLSISSVSVISSNSSMPGSSVARSGAPLHSGLAPVTKGRRSEGKLPDRPEESAPLAGFEMVTPVPKAANGGRAGVVTNPAKHSSMFPDSSSPPSSALFARRPVPLAAPAKSALTAMLAASSTSSTSNPFAELYSAISGRSDAESMNVQVYFPHAREPAGKALTLKVRKDATVEEVLGFALWTYWEESWLPKLDEGFDDEEDPKWAIKCSAIGWIFRIAEEDGEVDEDFPPPDRTGRISKFNFDAYAVLEATPAQVQQNKLLESKIQRRASRIVIKKKKSAGLLNLTTNATLVPPVDSVMGTSAGLSSLGSSLGMFPSSLGPSTSQGPPIYLRCRIADTADAGHVSTTIQVSGGMYMAEVLEAVCQRRKLSEPKDYALILDLGTAKVYIPLDRTVKSLQGKRDLILVKKSMLPTIGVEMVQGTGRTTDPNASILKRSSEVPEQPFNNLFDYTNAYRKYTVYRKVPMLVTRIARMLAIDGTYIHIMPLLNKTKHVFENTKIASYTLQSVVACQQSSKNSSTFKLVVKRDEERKKRYDFEAENPKTANEIVQTIRSLKMAMDRGGTLRQSRRSKHVNKDSAQAYI